MKDLYEFLNSQSGDKLFFYGVFTLLFIYGVFEGIADIIKSFRKHSKKDENSDIDKV